MPPRSRTKTPVTFRNTGGAIGGLLGDPVTEEEIATGNQRAPLKKIHRTRFKRLFYDPKDIENFAQQLKTEGGVHTALWVRPHPTIPEHYELIAGNRRYLASEIAGFTDAPIFVMNVDDRTALKLMRIENDQRQDFTIADELFQYLGELQLELDKSQSEVVKLLYRMDNERKGKSGQKNTQDSLGKSEATVVEQFFSQTRFAWTSFVSRHLPILKWPSDVLHALQKGQLSYEKLTIIKGIRDDDDRQELLEDAIDNNLTLEDIRVRAKELRPTSSPKEPTMKDNILDTFRQLKRIDFIRIDPAKRKKLVKLTDQIRELIAENEVDNIP